MWRTRADDLTSKRRELLTDLLADYLPTYCLMTESQPVVVYRISGQCEPTQVRHVTATDWLRLLVHEEGLNSEAKHAALEASDSITTKPDESWLSAPARLVSAFCATRIDPDRPHVAEATFFLEVCQRTRVKRAHGTFSAPTRPLGFRTFRCRCKHKHFLSRKPAIHFAQTQLNHNAPWGITCA